MAPFGDTVGFVDSDAGQLALLMYRVQMSTKVVNGAILWRDIEKSGFRMTAGEIPEDNLALGWCGRTVDCSCFDTGRAQCCHLIRLEVDLAVMLSAQGNISVPSRPEEATQQL